MSNVANIEKAVANLPPAEFAEFRAWFEAFDAQILDQKIAVDASSGTLDRLAEQALEAHRCGFSREL